MFFVFQAICLLFSLYTLHTYVITETHSRTHRLLPLVMGLVCLYNFYQMILMITGDADTFDILKDFLIVQMMYLLIYYLLDFFHIKMKILYGKILFTTLALADGSMVWYALQGKNYEAIFVLAYVTYYFIIIGMAIYATFVLSFSKRERFVDRLLIIAVFLPGMASLCRFSSNVMLKSLLMPGTLFISCGIILYLIKTERLIDTMSFLHENLFDKSETPILLFDTDFFYLDANAAAKEVFPQLKNITRKRRFNQYIFKMDEFIRSPGMATEMKIRDRYYKCVMEEQHADDKLKGYVLVIVDITEQKRETKLMMELKQEAEYQSRTKSRFLARMSHDMRSPMHSIIEVSDILSKKRDISERNRALLSHVKNAGDILLELINSMLEFSKFETGKFILNEREYQFERMIEDLSNISVMNLQSKPVHYEARITGEHPKVLLGDDIRIREVLHNILSNAVKFTAKGEITCTITAEDCEDERVLITGKITDTGSGMTEEQIQEAFKEHEGYGFGLSIVKQIIEMLDGTIQIESDGTSGTTVTVTFYQQSVDDKRYPEVTYTSESILEKDEFVGAAFYLEYEYPNAKILVVDDMRINREIFMEEIAPWKCDVDCATDGLTAIDAVKNKKYHMIFIDQMMPGMTGIEAAKQIKELQEDVVMIMMTGDAQVDIWDEAQAVGIMDYLAKPYNLADVQNLLDKYLPLELRQTPQERNLPDVSFYMPDQGVYRKVLKTFVHEIEDFEKHVEEYARNDIETFRIRVHGVKGVCKQLNKVQMGESAEIMEMAAKTGNTIYIADHLEKFHEDVLWLLGQLKMDLERITDNSAEQEKEKIEMSITNMWQQLREGFEQYDMDKIESMIKGLKDETLSDHEVELLKQLEALSEDFEYEEGSELLNTFLNGEENNDE